MLDVVIQNRNWFSSLVPTVPFRTFLSPREFGARVWYGVLCCAWVGL